MVIYRIYSKIKDAPLGKKDPFWSYFFGESGKKTERLRITSHEVFQEGSFKESHENDLGWKMVQVCQKENGLGFQNN